MSAERGSSAPLVVSGAVIAALVVILWVFIGGPLRWSTVGVSLRCTVGDDLACLARGVDGGDTETTPREAPPGGGYHEDGVACLDPSSPSCPNFPPPTDSAPPQGSASQEDPNVATAENACAQAETLETDAEALSGSTDEAAEGDRQFLLEGAQENRDRAAALGYPCR